MEPIRHLRTDKYRLWARNFSCLVSIVAIFIVSFTVDYNLRHDRFETPSFVSVAVIVSFPMYILLLVLRKSLSGLIADFSGFRFLLTQLNCCFLVVYGLLFGMAWQYLPEGMWQLIAPFITALVLESLFLAWKNYAPIEINRLLHNAPTIGEVWANANYSYYVEVFKDFEERLETFEKKKRQKDGTFIIRLKKLIIVVPLSCDIEGTLVDKHPNITYIGNLDARKDAQGGNVNREYKSSVYQVMSPDGDPSHYLYSAIEEPNTLRAVKKLKESVTEEIWKFQRDEFICTLHCNLKNHSSCVFLIYDDLKEDVKPLNEFLTEEITRLLELEKGQ